MAAMDSIGPVLSIDTATGAPSLGSDDGSGYLSGRHILPVTVKTIYEIARFVDVPVVGVGGVTSADAALQMIMAGATGVGMVTHPLLKGLEVFDTMGKEMESFLKERGWGGLSEIRGLTHRINGTRRISPDYRAFIDPELCTGCGLCRKICYSEAIREDDGIHRVEGELCVGCGLCAGVCPPGAIQYV